MQGLFLFGRVKGRSSLSGCRVESPALGTGAKRPVQVKGETLPSEVNAMRHFVLGIIRRKTLMVIAECVFMRCRSFSKTGQSRKGKEMKKLNETVKA